MKLVVGLGNPGIAYKRTRHNLGFLVADAFAAKKNMLFAKKSRFKAYEAMGSDLMILKPLTYMNLSGQSVQSAMHFYKLPLEDMIVISDDIALPFGELRLRAAGSSGGHKGLKNIEESLHSQAFARLRIGVGAPPFGENLEDFVLKPFVGPEREGLEAVINRAVEALELWLTLGCSKAMNAITFLKE